MTYSHFSYKQATAQDISVHWLSVTRQTVSIVRKQYSNDVDMSAKLDVAYKQYRTMLLLRKIDNL